MIAAMLATLFAAAAVLALAAIADSWRNHGAALLALRSQLQACSQEKEVRFTLITTQVNIASATIYRPVFGKAGIVKPAKIAA